jgi:uncharacterized membrane protein/5S rRNA maturation endonuclease (ribonuclease M5)
VRIEFGQPWILLLLVVLVPFIVWTGLRLRLVTAFRRALIIGTRLLVVTLLVLALARIHFVKLSNELDVFFVIDGSESVPEAQRREALGVVQSQVKKMRQADRAGIAVFGRNALIEEIPAQKLKPVKLLSEPDRKGTDIGEALRLAMTALAGQHMKRVVLLSDGNENEGAAIEAAESARAHQIPIDVYPLRYKYKNDVIVESVVVDSRVHEDEPFDVKIFVRSDQAAPARITVLRDNRPMSTEDVKLEPGKKNTFVLASQVDEPGFHTYRVQVDSPGDNNLENNQGYAFTYAAGPPRILFVDGNPPDQNKLVPVLQSEKITVDYVDALGLPDQLGALQSYDTIILSNVGADEVGEKRMKAIEQAVHELGVGFIMIGGEKSFGAGGYQDTPVERALPVSMDVSHKKILPRGALVIILHTCEIGNGNSWAREIALAALKVMSAKDLMGVLFFGIGADVTGAQTTGYGEQWLFPLAEVGNKTRMQSLIRNCSPGDMPSMDNTVKMAYDALVKCRASVKHCVLITDGDPAHANMQTILQQMKAAKITLSTVGISPHNPGDVQVLQAMAQYTGGNYYPVTNPNKLPEIFIKEATLVKKPLIFEEDFTPKYRSYTPILAGVGAELPMLKGYVCTSRKSLADVPVVSEKDDPVLAQWQYGVGKSVAFTSDAQARWAAPWLGWDKYAKFWTQAVRWTLRGQLSQNLQMQTEVVDGVGHVVIDAVDPDGNYINRVPFEGSVIDPSLEPPQPLKFRQTGPGRYEATFPVNGTGSFLVTARTQDEAVGGNGLIAGGLAIPYSPEYKDGQSNEALLRRVASISGGRYIEQANSRVNVFDHNLPSGSRPEPRWPLALALAILLVPIDVFFRRVMIDWRDVRRAWAAAAEWVRFNIRPIFTQKPRPERDEAMSALLQAKEKAREQAAPKAKAPSAEFLDSLQRAKGSVESGILEEAEEKQPGKPEPVVVRKSEKDELRGKPKAPAESFTGSLLEAKKRARTRKG